MDSRDFFVGSNQGVFFMTDKSDDYRRPRLPENTDEYTVTCQSNRNVVSWVRSVLRPNACPVCGGKAEVLEGRWEET